MELQALEKHLPAFASSRLAATVGLLGITIALDRVLNPLPFFEEVAPVLTLPFLLRSGLLLIVAVLLVTGLRDQLTAPLEDGARDSSRQAIWVAAVVGSGLSLTFALLVAAAPDVLGWLAEEDFWVEWASALLLFGSGLLLSAAALVQRISTQDWLLPAILLLFAGVFTLLGLEEVSWFQRVLDLSTPDMFENNRQQEINFHNFATELSAYSYFIVGTLFTTLLPFLLAGKQLPDRWTPFTMLVPPRSVLYATVFAAAITYKMWNLIPLQLTFWVSVVVLWLDDGAAVPRTIRRVALVTLVGTLLSFLLFGHQMGRSLDAEVREMLIPLGLFVYSVAVLRRTINP